MSVVELCCFYNECNINFNKKRKIPLEFLSLRSLNSNGFERQERSIEKEIAFKQYEYIIIGPRQAHHRGKQSEDGGGPCS